MGEGPDIRGPSPTSLPIPKEATDDAVKVTAKNYSSSGGRALTIANTGQKHLS